MTNNEIRIAIAEVCGWKLDANGPRCDAYGTFEGVGSKTMKWIGPDGSYLHPWKLIRSEADSRLPNYPEDLNACFQAREQLGLHKPENQADRVKWASCLRKALEPFAPVNKVGSPLISDIDCSTASAAIHAEAIARYLGVFH